MKRVSGRASEEPMSPGDLKIGKRIEVDRGLPSPSDADPFWVLANAGARFSSPPCLLQRLPEWKGQERHSARFFAVRVLTPTPFFRCVFSQEERSPTECFPTP